MDVSHFSERLRALREDRGLTQVQLANQSGITPSTVARLETDYRHGNRPGRVSVGTLEKLARVLEVPVSALLEDNESKPDENGDDQHAAQPA